ncbi:RND family transporter [uncultured Desulfuromusa sp.]|uniref:efflux RND transporter permease subunit n=1 Tax=uncultured Desulfuromusa sp. TaxID=219183 RepID=UPI0037494C8C
MDKLGSRVLSRPKTTIVLFFLVVVTCLVGITKFEVSFDVIETMGLKIPYVARLDYIGNTPVGSMYSYDVAIEFADSGDVKNPENLKKFEQLVGEIKTLPLTKKVTTLLDIIKDMNQVLNGGDQAYYAIPENREMIAQLLLLYENAGGVEAEKWVDYDYQRLRLMVEVTDYNSAEGMRELQLIQERSKELFPDAKVMLIGSISQFTVMMDYVTWGQLRSFLTALVVIGVLLIVVFGNIKIGLIAMIPNISPALVVGGIMGFAGIPLDIMTVTIMPMLLGLAVDDTIHFINHYQLEYNRTKSYSESTRRVFRTVGVALFLTSMALILNFSAYLGSLSKMYVNLGILVPAGIVAALLADYLVTPVLLKMFHPFGEELSEDTISPID